jgi:hypothetical protein
MYKMLKTKNSAYFPAYYLHPTDSKSVAQRIWWSNNLQVNNINYILYNTHAHEATEPNLHELTPFMEHANNKDIQLLLYKITTGELIPH